MKRFMASLICLVAVLSTSVSAANPPATVAKSGQGHIGQKCVITVPANYKNNPDPYVVYNPAPSARSYGLNRASIVVPVLAPCDAEWRSAYGTNWATEAKTIVKAGNAWLSREYGFSLSPTTKSYVSTGSDSYELTDDLRYNKFPGKTNVLVMGFSAKKISDSQTAGLSWTGGRYGMVFDNKRAMNTAALQHEIGHMYTLDHCERSLGSNYNPASCIMNPIPRGLLNRICSGHDQEWYSQRERY